MRILFEIGHPADVHLFRNAINEFTSRGHFVSVLAVAKESLRDLLSTYGIRYELVGKNTPTIGGKALTLAAKDLNLIVKAKRWKPDIIVSMSSPYAAHASAVLGIPHIAFNDTEISILAIRIMLPFTDAICTPSCFGLDLGRKQFRFDGYKELAYLHPNWFKPDPAILDQIGVHPEERIIVVRFGVIDSSHDLRYHGLNLRTVENRMAFVRALEEYGKVFVTSEAPLDAELKLRAPNLPIAALHDLLYYASLYVGDGATMASEAGVLGTPWIYVSDSSRGYLDEQQNRYGLGFRVESASQALSQAIDLMQAPGLKATWKKKREKMLAEKIDVTQFIVRFIENWSALLIERAGTSAAKNPYRRLS
jgi:predicted glycosyltransferase